MSDPTRLDRFLASVERPALRIAQSELRHTEDALDAVQDAMLKLAQRYADRGESEWTPLFYRILRNRVRDLQRRRRVRNAVLGFLPGQNRRDGEAPADPLEQVPAAIPRPEETLQVAGALQALEDAVAELPARQREAFMLRTVQNLDVRETAAAMRVSTGSVKTHYSRALKRLRAKLGEHWP